MAEHIQQLCGTWTLKIISTFYDLSLQKNKLSIDNGIDLLESTIDEIHQLNRPVKTTKYVNEHKKPFQSTVVQQERIKTENLSLHYELYSSHIFLKL